MDMMKQFSLEGKVALITGAAYGIGFAIAEAYAACGAKIAFNCRGEKHMEEALKAYAEKGIDAHGYYCDVTNEEDVVKMVADIEKELGTIDILVNNAGIIKRIPMIEMEAKDFRQVIDIDLTAPFIVSKAVIPGMIKKGHGKIINICSMMSELGRETVSAYAAAKGGLKMLTRNICSEYGEYNIQCNGIGPGYIATPQTAPLRERQPDGSRHPFDQFTGRVPCFRRLQLRQRPRPVRGRRHPGLHRQAALTSDETRSISLPRFAKEPRKLHIRSFRLPLPTQTRFAGLCVGDGGTGRNRKEGLIQYESSCFKRLV